jgi:hypothetical protein
MRLVVAPDRVSGSLSISCYNTNSVGPGLLKFGPGSIASDGSFQIAGDGALRQVSGKFSNSRVDVTVSTGGFGEFSGHGVRIGE